MAVTPKSRHERQLVEPQSAATNTALASEWPEVGTLASGLEISCVNSVEERYRLDQRSVGSVIHCRSCVTYSAFWEQKKQDLHG